MGGELLKMTLRIPTQTMNRLIEQIAQDITPHLYHQWRDDAIREYDVSSEKTLDEHTTETIIDRYLEFRSEMKKRKRHEELFER